MTVSPRSRRRKVAWLVALVAMAACGCSGTGSKGLSLNPRRIALREQLSRIEFQNQQLKDELKVAQQDSKRLANELQLAEIDNKDLERRLESFRTQLGLNSSPGGGSAAGSYDVARPFPGGVGPDSGTTRPASQPPARAPFTRIPNPAAIDVSPPPGPSAEEFYGDRRSPSYEQIPRPRIEPPPVRYFDLSPSAGRSELGLSPRAANSTWMPLARGSGRSARD